MQGQLGQKKRQWRSQLLTTIRNISNENRQNLRVKIIQTNKNLPLPKTVFLFSMTYLIYSIQFYFCVSILCMYSTKVFSKLLENSSLKSQDSMMLQGQDFFLPILSIRATLQHGWIELPIKSAIGSSFLK